jgi:hypothetical protein
MRDSRAGVESALQVTRDLDCDTVAAVVYGPNRHGKSLLRMNGVMLSGQHSHMVLSWARRELARGKRVAWLLADQLDGLA